MQREMSDEADCRAFWDHIQRTTGSRSSSWATFSANFEISYSSSSEVLFCTSVLRFEQQQDNHHSDTYLRRHYAGEMARLPDATRAEAEMVLRYAFDRGSPARAAEGKPVTPRHLALFLNRFGPMRCCLLKAARSLFDSSGCLVPWFHGKTSREEARRAIEEWEASRGDGKKQRGVFLFRYSDRQPAISFSFRRKRGGKEVVACLIHNEPRGYTVPDVPGNVWGDLQEFVAEPGRGEFVHPVPSALYLECKEEIEARRQAEKVLPTPENLISDARRLYLEAQTLVIRDIGTGVEATRILEKGLSFVQEVDLIVEQLEQAEPQLQVKALRLGGDILWRLHRQEEGVASYLRCLSVVAEAEKLQDAIHEGSPLVTASVLSHVHQQLADYFLRQGSPGRGLDHFSELVACTTNEDARRQLVHDFRKTDGFRRATAGLTNASVEAMLDEGISYFRREDYEPAGEKFEKVLRDARCIGEGKVEARALGNLATVDYKTRRIPAAIRRYRMCVQLLRQQGNQVKERKILNYLVMCCIEAQRWVPAKLFHEQLSKLAESEQNIRHLRRLEDRIEDGVALQARQQGGAAPAGTSGGGGGGSGSRSGGGSGGLYFPSQQRGSALDDGGGSGDLQFHSRRHRSPTSGGDSNINGQHGGAPLASGSGGGGSGGSGGSYSPSQRQGAAPASDRDNRGMHVKVK
ncbi:unnamed protein product [Pylaiella littoralis]